MNIEIDIAGENILKFNNLQTDTSLVMDDSDGTSIEHDIEKLEGDNWLVHIDVWFTQPHIASAYARISFVVPMPFEQLWNELIATEYTRAALESLRLGFNEACKATKINYFLEERYSGKEQVAACTKLLLEDVEANGLYSTEDKDGYNWNTVSIPPEGNNFNIAGFTLLILDEIFFDNPAFNRQKNMDTFDSYIPVRFYTTIKMKIMQLSNKQTVHLSLKQLIIYIMMLRCSCTLLLSDHYDAMKNSLDKKGVTEDHFNHYIQATSAFLRNLQTGFDKKKVTMLNLEEDIDWAGLVC